MKILAILLLAQFALVYTDVSHLTQNYLPPPSRAHTPRVPVDEMRTTMTFEQHELQELPEQIEYVQQLPQKPADIMDQKMLQQYLTPSFEASKPQAVTYTMPRMLPVDYLTQQMEQQLYQQASNNMPQMQTGMLAMQFMPRSIDIVDMYPDQQSRQLYSQKFQEELMRQPEMSEQRMETLRAMPSMDVVPMQQQQVEQMTHILNNNGYHYKSGRNAALLHRFRH